MNKKIKISVLICIIVLTIGIFSGFAVQEETYTAFDPQCEKLSGLSDQGIFEFLHYYQVDVPDDYIESETELADCVRNWIERIEERPTVNPVIWFNYTVTHNFGTAVYNAVVEHYGWDTTA